VIKQLQKAVFAFMFGFILLANQGCIPLLIGAAAGAGGVVFIKGNLEQNVDYPVKHVYEASLDGLKRLNIDVYQKTLNDHSALIYGRFDTGEKARVVITALTEQASSLKIRVGFVGDESKSSLVLDAIKKAL
jgi:hypothetical protein